ncbi:MAG: tyrosine-type recombinase/integrase [Chloroflexota bacterium]|nr:tyrosine-type recombinase/integrase [Chloroflexota bacterium]
MQTHILSLPSQTQSASLDPVFETPADRHPALVYLAGLAPGSRRTMRHALDAVAATLTDGRCDHRTLPWAALRFQHAQAVRAALMQRYSAATTNKMLSALRQTLRVAWRLGYLTAEDYQRAVDLKPVNGDQPDAAAGRALSYGEWAALFAVCAADPTAAGVRDAALIALLKVGGLRRAEIASLQLADYDRSTATFTIRGKRNRIRTLPVEDPGALGALDDWLHLRGGAPGALFTRIRKGEFITQEGLSDQGVYYVLNRRGRQAGTAPFTPHDLRRTFAGDLLDAGVDLSTVQKLMGHAGANTTAGYDRRGEQAKRSAVQKLHVPYRRRFGGDAEV